MRYGNGIPLKVKLIRHLLQNIYHNLDHDYRLGTQKYCSVSLAFSNSSCVSRVSYNFFTVPCSDIYGFIIFLPRILVVAFAKVSIVAAGDFWTKISPVTPFLNANNTRFTASLNSS